MVQRTRYGHYVDLKRNTDIVENMKTSTVAVWQVRDGAPRQEGDEENIKE